MATTVKVTKKERFADIAAMISGDSIPMLDDAPRTSQQDAIDFIAHEVELLSKKNSSISRQQAESAAADERYKALILDFLAGVEGGMRCSDIGAAIDELSDFRTSKMSHLCNALVKDGRVVKNKTKDGMMFSLA